MEECPMIQNSLMLAEDGIIVFGMWQILSIVGIVGVLIGYKIYKNKTMS
jgi:hypothetical protein